MGSAFWNVVCSSLHVEHCSVVGVNDFAAGCTSAAWQPGRVPPVIHMILFGIDQAVVHPLPISSPCPPPVLLSSAPGQGWDIRKTAWAKTSFVFRSIQKLPNSQLQHFPFWVFSHLPSSLSFFTLHFLSFPPILSPLPVCWSPSVSHSLPRSIINFNLRAGLNGTIRERSMLLIWMPARLDLGTPHQRKGGGKKANILFIIGTSHTHEPAHTNHWSKTWVQEMGNICTLSSWDKVTVDVCLDESMLFWSCMGIYTETKYDWLFSGKALLVCACLLFQSLVFFCH